MDAKKNATIYGEVIAKCWEDDAYKKRFLQDPEAVLVEAGFEVEEGVTYRVIEAPKLVEYLVLPAEKPQEATKTISRAFLEKAEQGDTLIPEGAEVRIIQNTEDTRTLILPASPKALSQAELARIAGGDAAVVTTNVVQTGAVVTTAVAIDPAPVSLNVVAQLTATAVVVLI